MNRFEENQDMIAHLAKSTMEMGKGTCEEMVSWHLGVISCFLMDISVSLAMIADKMASSTGEEVEE